MDCKLGLKVCPILLEGVAVDAEVVAFEELDIPGIFRRLVHFSTLTLALSRQGIGDVIQGFCVGCIVWDSGVDVGFVAFAAFVALGAVDDCAVGTKLGVGAGEGQV